MTWFIIADKQSNQFVPTGVDGKEATLLFPTIADAVKYASRYYNCTEFELGAKCRIDSYVVIGQSKVTNTVTRAQWGDGVACVNFFDEQAKWSRATFGPDEVRGPVGPLKHLVKEAQEAIDATTADQRSEEIADCLFLVFDAARRHGFSLRTLIEACEKKLEKNKQREWPTPTTDEPVEHDRSKES